MAFDIAGAIKEGYSEDEIAKYLASKRRFDYEGAINEGYTSRDVLKFLSPSLAEQPDKERTWGEFAADSALSLGKGVIGAGQAVVGLADIVTGNEAGRLMKEGIGYDPKRSIQILSDLQSEKQQQADARVSAADGFVDTAKSLVTNPSAISGGVLESIPSMIGPVAAGRIVANRAFATGGEIHQYETALLQGRDIAPGRAQHDRLWCVETVAAGRAPGLETQ